MRSKYSLHIFCSLFAALLCYNNVFAQTRDDGISDLFNRHELSISLGANNFLGDLGGNQGAGKTFVKDYMLKTIRPLVGFSYAFYPENWYKLTFGLNVTQVNGADSLIKNTGELERWRVYRNLSFRSNITEAYVGAEIYLRSLIDKYHTVHKLDPFVNIGIGLFHFNPQTKYRGQWVDLEPLHLEGQGFAEYPDRKQYSLTQIYIPFSIGLKYYLDDHFAISGGVNFRKTFTDYIDDVSTAYIDPSLFYKYLAPDKAALATQLYQRSLRPEKVKPGVDRGHKGNDSYVSIFFTLSFVFGKGGPFYYGGM